MLGRIGSLDGKAMDVEKTIESILEHQAKAETDRSAIRTLLRACRPRNSSPRKSSSVVMRSSRNLPTRSASHSGRVESGGASRLRRARNG